VLSTTLLYFVLSRILLLDMAVSVLMSATLFCFILGVRETDAARRRWID
jgi:dolichyl-phosphate-mannose--protein O-mannosyl transferase